MRASDNRTRRNLMPEIGKEVLLCEQRTPLQQVERNLECLLRTGLGHNMRHDHIRRCLQSVQTALVALAEAEQA